MAYEEAERTSSPEEKKKQLTFVIVGGGPTGVELAGAIGEMSRFTLSREFKNIDAKLAGDFDRVGAGDFVDVQQGPGVAGGSRFGKPGRAGLDE